jgi:hypothetical protein
MPSLMYPLANGQGYGSSPLVSTTNFYEHELIFFLPSELLTEMKVPQLVPDSVYVNVVSRMEELTKWVEAGHTLVVLGLHPAPFQFAMQNRASSEMIENFQPFNRVQLTAKSGSSIQTAPEKEIVSLLGGFVNSLPYNTVMKGVGLIPLLTVRATSKTVGPADIIAGYVEVGGGLVIFSPRHQGPGQPYWLALQKLPSVLRREKPDVPAWVDSFRTTDETNAFDDVASRKGEVERLHSEIADLEVKIAGARHLKHLFVGSGPSFEEAVCDALRELGLDVVPGPHPRADLLVSSGVRIAAVEAKGVEGAAKEEYVRQVMMWMPEVDAALSMPTDASGDPVLAKYREQLEKLNLERLDRNADCKGILVLGTFRLLPLDQRAQPDFVENVVQVLTRQDICAVTGLQLYCLVLMARSDPANKEKIRLALFETRGVLDMARNWREVLKGPESLPAPA